MTVDRFVYESIRETRPGLELPPWYRLRRVDRHRAKRMTVDEFVSRRVAKLLARTEGGDALQPQRTCWPPHDIRVAKGTRIPL